ncbi:Type 1 glutamine amidotransferase-like domain-containing protein [Chitinimonas sp. PSY-7]|uniref:Type 1 glutamine amidotransferase-like domain-containing protein n=1 Tax=Chitinimonas sp. PSY-7 TaxID=3459088 RepID=UPI00403FF6AE
MQQLIVLGGGGFSMEKSPLLDQYVLHATRKEKPRICFIPTASGDADNYLLKFYAAHAGYNCLASHLSLFRPHTNDIAGYLLEQDVIFVGGGNTKSMLALWHDWQIDSTLKQAYEQGTVIGGISAGMICWFEYGLTDSIPGALTPLPGLGWLAGGACPHYDGESERRPSLHHHVASGAMPTTWAADDGAALHFIDGQFHAAITSRPNAKAWRISSDTNRQITETAIDCQYLGITNN